MTSIVKLATYRIALGFARIKRQFPAKLDRYVALKWLQSIMRTFEIVSCVIALTNLCIAIKLKGFTAFELILLQTVVRSGQLLLM